MFLSTSAELCTSQDNTEVHFKIKRTTQLRKLKQAYCDRQVSRFLFLIIDTDPLDAIEYYGRSVFKIQSVLFTNTGQLTFYRPGILNTVWFDIEIIYYCDLFKIFRE